MNSTLWAKQHLEEIILTSWQKKFHNPPPQRTWYLVTFSLYMGNKTFLGPHLWGICPFLCSALNINVSLYYCSVSLAFGNTAKLGGMLPPALFTVVQISPFSKDLFGSMPPILCRLSETSFPVFSQIRRMCVCDSHVICNSNF